LPDKVVVTGGLSKSMALGGWRIGFLRLPASAWGERTRAELLGVASEVWSCLAAPMQHVAAYVLDDPALVRAHIARSRRLHAMVARAAHTVVIGAGARCRPPAGGFYLYPDLAPFRRRLAARGITDGRGLADALLDAHGVAVLPGVAFGESPTALRFRMATSLLYGQTDAMRWLALGGDEPTRLPWIADGLTWLGDALAALLV
jgi:aspartate aminotransferase